MLEQLTESEVHLLGMSFGGWTAANLAVHRPDKIASLSLLDPILVFGNFKTETVVRSIPASVKWFPNCSPVINREHPVDLVRDVAAFLDKVE